MDTRKSRKGLWALVLQLLITVFYTAMVIHTATILHRPTAGFISEMINFLPMLIIHISSLILQFILRIKHKAYTQEDIMPVLFLFISTLSCTVIPFYSEITDIWFISPNIIAILMRFSLLSTAILFVFSAIQYYGINISRMKLYLAIAQGASAFISLQIPLDTGTGEWSRLYFSSIYDGYLVISLIIISLAAIITYAAAVIKDRATHNISRALGASLLIIGYLTAAGSSIISVELTAAFIYLTGIVLISVSTRNNPW